MRAVPSRLAEAMRLPSGKNATLGHGAAVALVLAQLLAGRRIPDAHGAVMRTAGDDALAVRRERDAIGGSGP